MNAQNRRTSGAESPRKVLTMLLAFSERRPNLSADEMAREIGVPLSTAYRYISLLREVGLLQEGPQRTYSVTQRVIPLARAARAANRLDAICQPVLDRLSATTGEASLIVRRVGHTAMCVALAEADHPIRLSFEVGRPMPLHGGAAAKILLAGLSEKESQRYLSAAAATDAPLAERRSTLEHELEEIRRTGWAQSSGEVDRGIWAAAAAIREGKRVVAALTIACLAHSVGSARQQEILGLVREAAGGINIELEKLQL
jgi:DNA-binding IclR family transcriptional regulator